MEEEESNQTNSKLNLKDNILSKNEPVIYKAPEMDKTIRFRSLNRDHNFIFIRNKNSIQIIEPIKLISIYTFHHNESIVDFAIEPKKSSLIICTQNFMEIYSLICSNLSDYELKIKYELHKSISSENIQNISVSALGDCITVINQHRGIKLYDMELNLIKNLSLTLQIIPKDQELFPLDVFLITYDTRTIICCKYNQNKISFIYKCRSVSEEDKQNEYAEKVIPFKEDILYFKEYQKSFAQYIDYQDSSIFFILTTGLNFLILRKIYEIDPETYDYIPNTMILLYIDLSAQTETHNFPSISFSLLYDNENPIFKGEQKLLLDYQSGIVNMSNWNLSTNKNTLSDNEQNTFLNYNGYYLKNISCDYLIFNFRENLVMYQVNGLQSPPFNNPTVDKISIIFSDNNYDSSFVLLKITKTFDKNYSMFFVDKYATLRKFIVRNTLFTKNSNSNITNLRDQKSGNNEVTIFNSKKAFTLFKNIVYAEYNDKQRKTLVYEQHGSDSLISIINSKLDFSKMFILQDGIIIKIHWVKESNFIVFTYLYQNDTPVICIIHVYSKYLGKTINMLTHEKLLENHICIIPLNLFNIPIKNILDIFLESPYLIGENIVDKKAEKNKKSYNDIKTDMLIKTNSSLIYCNLSIETIPKKQKDEGKEFIYVCNKKWDFDKQNFPIKNEWDTQEFAFNSNKVYFLELDTQLRIVNIREIDSDGELRTIFQTAIFHSILFSKLYFNNYFIFITSYYINSYDISNRIFYRIRNDYLTQDPKTKQLNISIDMYKCGIYVSLLFLSETGIKLVRIPRNKNKNEAFSYAFDYKFSIGKKFSKITLQNGMVILNETQIERLSDISHLNHQLLFNLKEKELLLLNSNANSLYDCETFLDFFLSDNEEIIKLILNIFCNLYINNHKNFTDAYKNSKLIPNLFELNSIDYIIKIIFDNDLNVLSMIGGQSSRRNSISSNTDNKPICKMRIDNAKLKFKTEEDDQEQNPINLWCSKSSNLTHMKYIYDLISSENTRNIDHFTKYFILKMKSKKEDFIAMTFKMSTADLCWLFLINNQEYLLKFITDDQVKTMTWDLMTLFSIPLWLKNDIKLKELLEHVGRNEYRKMLKEEHDPRYADKTVEKNYTEKIALYFYLADKEKLIIDFLEREPHNEKIKKFIQRDFTIQKNRFIAKENADLLVTKKKYIYAAYFYLLADDIRSALDMTLEKMKDINLTICLLRLVKSKYGNDTWMKYYSLDRLYQEFFINFGTVIRDPWLVVFGYLGQKKIDCALEYLLNYNVEYIFDTNEQVFENLDEYNDHLEIIRKIFGLNVFDYKILLFAKNLEKLYLTQLQETQNQVKNVANTNFEDLWDMDENEEDTKPNLTDNNNIEVSGKLKEIEVDYKNLATLCLVNSLKRGALYAPIINMYKMIYDDSFTQLTLSQKDTIKCLISDRIVLDSLFTYNKPSIEKYFTEIDSLFSYLENSKIVKKKDLHSHIILGFLKLDEYQSAHIPCFKSNKIRETLIWLTNYIEKLMNKNIDLLANFNFYENVNLNKIVENLQKFLQVSFFLVIVLSHTGQAKEISSSFINKSEKNLYFFRIIFMMNFYLLFVAKLIMKYKLIPEIFQAIEILAQHHKKIENYIEEIANKDIAHIISLCNKLSSKINKEITGTKKIYRDEGLSFFLHFLNYGLMVNISRFLMENKDLEINHINPFNNDNNNDNNDRSNINLAKVDHYVHEEFKFVNRFNSLMKSYIDNFDVNMEKYIKNYMSCELIADIHKELKSIYMTHPNHQEDFPAMIRSKYKIIQIQKIFSRSDQLQAFESKFKISSVIIKYISLLCKQFKYNRKSTSSSSDYDHHDQNYTEKSIEHVQEIFKKGFEIASFPETLLIQDFAINSCDMSNFAVSFLEFGHKKVNMLYNLLLQKRTEDFYQMSDINSSHTSAEDIYKESFLFSYKDIIEESLHNKYNELLAFLNYDIIGRNRSESCFPSQITLPPEMFNEIPSERYEEEISLNEINSNSYCKLLESHPQLPLYLSSNNKGMISLWSYNSDNKKSLDEFSIEKITKDTMNKANRNLNRMKFNAYGNEFLACDQEGNLFVWSFDHIKSTKLPKISLFKNDLGFSKDACFLNNTGIIASTNNKGTERHKSYMWDLLLPLKHCNVGEVNVGGNFIVPISSDATFAVVNNTPGSIHIVDVRRMEVVKEFNAHLNEIKAVKLSERENFLVTMGKDSLVKIWDMSIKSEPSLIEAFEVFGPSKDETKSRFHLDIVNQYLFASKDNTIKLLRNKIS